MRAEDIALTITQNYGFDYENILDSVMWEMEITSNPSTIMKRVIEKEIEELQF